MGAWNTFKNAAGGAGTWLKKNVGGIAGDALKGLATGHDPLSRVIGSVGIGIAKKYDDGSGEGFATDLLKNAGEKTKKELSEDQLKAAAEEAEKKRKAEKEEREHDEDRALKRSQQYTNAGQYIRRSGGTARRTRHRLRVYPPRTLAKRHRHKSKGLFKRM